MVSLIKNPWDTLFYSLIKDCKTSLKITSPYIKSKVVTELLANKLDSVSLQIITSCKLINFYRSASDTEALKLILDNNGRVFNYQALHSKIYLFDNIKAIVTSANLTNKGLINNFEYGLLIEESHLVTEIEKDFNDLIRNENTGTVKNDNLSDIDNIMKSVPKEKRLMLPMRIPIITPDYIGMKIRY